MAVSLAKSEAVLTVRQTFHLVYTVFIEYTLEQIAHMVLGCMSLVRSVWQQKMLHNCFKSSFKHDKEKNATLKNDRIIEAGNSWAHDGNVMADIKLYTTETN